MILECSANNAAITDANFSETQPPWTMIMTMKTIRKDEGSQRACP
jgi:hypothetical protein